MIAFRGRLDFCSNFHECVVELDGTRYPSAEHAYQAMKTLDPVKRRAIAFLSTPGEAKKAGRRLPLRPDWEAVKIEEMRRVVRAKFLQNEELRLRLIMTDPEPLAEVNEWNDRFWGECPQGHGLNWLGKILMEVRDAMRREFP